MYQFYLSKQQEIEQRKKDEDRNRSIQEIDFRIKFLKNEIHDIDLKMMTQRDNELKLKEYSQQKLFKNQMIQNLRQQKLVYQNNQMQKQQKEIISKILRAGFSKYDFLKDEFPQYILFCILEEDDAGKQNQILYKIKNNTESLENIKKKLVKFIQLVEIAKKQEERKSIEQNLKIEQYKRLKNNKKAKETILSKQLTDDIITNLTQLILNFQYQLTQIDESEQISNKICYIFIHEEFKDTNFLFKKIFGYMKRMISIPCLKEKKTEFREIYKKWKKLCIQENQLNDDENEENTHKKLAIQSSINKIKHEIAAFYISFMIFCNDDSRQMLEQKSLEYIEKLKNKKEQSQTLENLLKKKYNYFFNFKLSIIDQKIKLIFDEILDIQTKKIIGFFDKNNDNLYNDIFIFSKTMINSVDQINKHHGKSLFLVIMDRLNQNDNDDNSNESNEKETTFQDLLELNINNTLSISLKVLKEKSAIVEPLVFSQAFKYDQISVILEKIREKLSLKESQSKIETEKANECNSDIKTLNLMLQKNLDRLEQLKNRKNDEKIQNKPTESHKKNDKNTENVNDIKKQLDETIIGCKKVKLSDYTLKSKIREGGHGEIKSAKCNETGEEVAIKFYKYIKDDIEYLKDAIRGINISNCDVPGLVKTIGYNMDDFFIVMRYYKINDLYEINKKYIKSKGSVHDIYNPTVRSKIIFGIASIMKQLHSKNIVLCDLKLQNIVLNDDLEPMIIDFELAFYNGELNGENYMRGTPMYIAPENIYGIDLECESQFPCDVYSYSILLYFMFSIDFKFTNTKIKSTIHLFNLITKGERPDKPEGIPEHYWDLICHCWSQDPNDRPTFEQITFILKNDKYALEEFGMKTDINELHKYQKKINGE